MSHTRAILLSAAVAAVVVIAFGRVSFLKAIANPTTTA